MNNFTVRIHKLDLENVPGNITGPVDKSAEFVRNAVRATLDAERKPPACDMSVIFTSDKYIAKLNQRYLEKNQPTDILCFPYSGKPPFKCDMFISIESSYRQSGEYKHTHQEEITFLVIHGILHLLGWRDDKDEPRKRMLKRQEEILKLIH